MSPFPLLLRLIMDEQTGTLILISVCLTPKVKRSSLRAGSSLTLPIQRIPDPCKKTNKFLTFLIIRFSSQRSLPTFGGRSSLFPQFALPSSACPVKPVCTYLTGVIRPPSSAIFPRSFIATKYFSYPLSTIQFTID